MGLTHLGISGDTVIKPISTEISFPLLNMEAEVKEHGNSDCGLHEANSETCNSGGKKDEVDGGSVELSESMELSEGGVGNEDGCVESDRLKDTVDESSAVQVHVKLAETVTVVEEGPRNFSSEVHAENVSFSVQNESLIQKKSLDDICILASLLITKPFSLVHALTQLDFFKQAFL